MLIEVMQNGQWVPLNTLAPEQAIMQKGIRFTVKLWVEGEDEPAHNLLIRQSRLCARCWLTGQSVHPNLKLTIRKIEEDTSGEDEESA